MKKIIIILGVVLTSGVAALALSQTNGNEVKTAQIKADRNDLVKCSGAGNYKSNVATAD